MMLDINLEELREGFWRWFPMGLGLAGLIVFEMVWVLGSRGVAEIGAKVTKHAADYSNTKELGRLIYTQYVYAFEIASVVLLVAIIAAIALTLRKRRDAKRQEPSEQIKVKRNDRVRLISMPAVKKTNAAETTTEQANS
jgi:NADH-quinone oxidoreductase subunit J